MAVRAWRAERAEAAIVARLLVGFRDHLGHDWPSDNAFLASVERLIDDPATEYLLGAPDDDSPPAAVAQVRFRHSVWTAAPDCWLEDLFVAPEARRRGLGDALVALTVARATERGSRRVELDCIEDNAAALALYERHGFSANAKGPARALLLGRRLDER